MFRILLVGIGGFFGAVARYSIGTFFVDRFGLRVPYGTFVINMTGCFLVGFVASFLTIRTNWSELWIYIVSIGFIGAYTTFSTFEFETLRSLQKGDVLIAFSNITLSIFLGLLAVWTGAHLGERV